jgi:hypothetical protein
MCGRKLEYDYADWLILPYLTLLVSDRA